MFVGGGAAERVSRKAASRHLVSENQMKIGTLITVLVLLCAGLFGAMPYVTVYQMKVAAEQKDSDALSAHINYASVRRSFKDQLSRRMTGEVDGDPELRDNPFAKFGVALANTLSGAMVDAYITPESVRKMMAGQVPAVMDEKPRPTPEEENGSERTPFDRISLGYQSLDRFVVQVEREGKDIDFVLKRSGLVWNLSEILLPLDQI